MKIIYSIHAREFGGYEVRNWRGSKVMELPIYATWIDANQAAELWFKRELGK